MPAPSESSGDRSGLLRPDRRPHRRLSDLRTDDITPGDRGGDGAPGGLGDDDAVVGGITLDSRLVEPGDLYVALPGRHTHGAHFAAAAVQRGAVAVLTDPAGVKMINVAGTLAARRVPVLVAADPRASMGELAARLYDRPAETLTMIGITGTNGKTTTAFLVEAALRSIGRRVGVIGTLGFRLDGADLGGIRTTVTTPESVDLHALLALMRDRGADTVVMEVSSHALALHRVAGVRFDATAFTNLGRDHLDFHPDMEHYFATKAKLFSPELTRAAVINIDDRYGQRLRAGLDHRVRVITTSSRIDRPDADQVADWQVVAVRPDRSGTQVRTLVPPAGPTTDGALTFRLALPGDYNVHNAITALALVDLVGGPPTAAATAATAATGLAEVAVPGRMEAVDLGLDAPVVVVDFAHTPQAVTAALTALDGDPLVVVLGCGGDRDAAKRGPMGAAAATSADVVVVTDDNPRSEEPAAIRAAVLAGARTADRPRATTILDGLDRRSAIRTALTEATRPAARTVDRAVVAILGKGHEHGQELTGPDGLSVTLPFDDVLVAAEEWLRLADPGQRPAGTQP